MRQPVPPSQSGYMGAVRGWEGSERWQGGGVVPHRLSNHAAASVPQRCWPDPPVWTSTGHGLPGGKGGGYLDAERWGEGGESDSAEWLPRSAQGVQIRIHGALSRCGWVALLTARNELMHGYREEHSSGPWLCAR